MIKIDTSNLLTVPMLLQSHGENEKNTLIHPFNAKRETISSPEMQGKRCFGSIGTHLFLFDPKTNECFFLDRISMSKISLPVMPCRVTMFCSLSLTSALSSPDCAVIFAGFTINSEEKIENFIVFCHLNDDKWTQIIVELADREIFIGSSIVQREKLYVQTSLGIVVFDIPALINGGIIEKKMIMAPEVPFYPVANANTRYFYLVESLGDIFMVRMYLHNASLVYLDIHRLLHDNNNTSSEQVWERVDTIGERVFFIEKTRGTSARAEEVGVECNCIYSVLSAGGGGVYKYSLEDRTAAFHYLLGRRCWSYESIFCWLVLPTRPERILESVSGLANLVLNEELPQISEVIEEMEADVFGPWANLPIDIFKFLLTKVSLVDVINLRAVCKTWKTIPTPFAKIQTWPWLMYHTKTDGTYRFLDPVNAKQYTTKIEELSLNAQNDRVLLLCSKNGWVVALIDDRKLVMINPFRLDKAISSPPLSGIFKFNAVAFSSVPTCLDCIVFGISIRAGCRCCDAVEIFMWRPGLKEETWDKIAFKNEGDFELAYTNPVFVKGEFYCLGQRGQVGVFNPTNRTWKVLDNLELICYASSTRKSYLVELEGEVGCVIKESDGRDTKTWVLKLYQTERAWGWVQDLGDVAIFLDSNSSVAKLLPDKTCGNKIFSSSFDASNECVFICGERKISNIEKLNLKEPMDCLWLEPNLNT